MLILSRDINKGIIVMTPDGKTVTVRILDTGKDKVKIGISAPGDYEVLRDELLFAKEV